MAQEAGRGLGQVDMYVYGSLLGLELLGVTCIHQTPACAR